MDRAGRREEPNTFLVHLSWDAQGRPTGSIQFGEEAPVVIAGWLSLMAQFVRNMPEVEVAQT